MSTFDFSVRLSALVEGCLEGGNKPQELQIAMIEEIKELNKGGNLFHFYENVKMKDVKGLT